MQQPGKLCKRCWGVNLASYSPAGTLERVLGLVEKPRLLGGGTALLLGVRPKSGGYDCEGYRGICFAGSGSGRTDNSGLAVYGDLYRAAESPARSAAGFSAAIHIPHPLDLLCV